MVFNNVGAELQIARNDRYNERYGGGPVAPRRLQAPFYAKTRSSCSGRSRNRSLSITPTRLYRPADFTQLQDLIATNPDIIIQIGGQDGTFRGWSYNMRDPVLQDVRVSAH
jgi:hypothetical protein